MDELLGQTVQGKFESLMLQKRAARVILEADTRSNSVKLFKKLARLRLHDEIKLNKSTLVFKRLQGSCPAYMCDLLKFNADLHTRTGRDSKLNLACPRFKEDLWRRCDKTVEPTTH